MEQVQGGFCVFTVEVDLDMLCIIRDVTSDESDTERRNYNSVNID